MIQKDTFILLAGDELGFFGYETFPTIPGQLEPRGSVACSDTDCPRCYLVGSALPSSNANKSAGSV